LTEKRWFTAGSTLSGTFAMSLTQPYSLMMRSIRSEWSSTSAIVM